MSNVYIHSALSLNPIEEPIPTTIITLIVVFIIVRIAIPALIRIQKRWANNAENRHFKEPSTWFKLEPKLYFKTESALLANGAIIETLAPSPLFLEEISDDNNNAHIPHMAWLSAYPRGIRATIKRNKPFTRGGGKRLNARAQINKANKKIVISEVPKYVGLSERQDPSKHYVIKIQLDGGTLSEYQKLSENIKSQLNLNEITVLKTHDNSSISFLAHEEEPRLKLTDETITAKFLDDHPMPKSLNRIPLAMQSNGEVWSLPIAHTLILGTTGSGKGSPIQGIIRQCAPKIKEGLVKLYGIDPKSTELIAYKEARNYSLFTNIATRPEGYINVIKTVYEIMEYRARTKTVNIEKGELSRTLETSKKYPMILLIIDEFLSITRTLGGFREGKESIKQLEQIFAQGRSLGIVCIVATQSANINEIGTIRQNCANAVAFKQESPHINDQLLGQGAGAEGYDSTSIRAATAANNYATAGLAYVKTIEGKPTLIRFAYCSDADINQLINKYNQKPERPTQTNKTDGQTNNGTSGDPDDTDSDFDRVLQLI